MAKDEYTENMSIFQEKIAIAQAALAEKEGDGWVETTPEIIKILKPRGLGEHNGSPVKHFSYHGILVCEYGQKEKLLAEFDEPLNNRKHGTMEATVISGRH